MILDLIILDLIILDLIILDLIIVGYFPNNFISWGYSENILNGSQGNGYIRKTIVAVKTGNTDLWRI